VQSSLCSNMSTTMTSSTKRTTEPEAGASAPSSTVDSRDDVIRALRRQLEEQRPPAHSHASPRRSGDAGRSRTEHAPAAGHLRPLLLRADGL